MAIGEDLRKINTTVGESVQTVIEASGIVALSGIKEILGRTLLSGPRKRSEENRRLGQELARVSVERQPIESDDATEIIDKDTSAMGENVERWVSDTGEGRITGNRRIRPKNGENARKPDAVVVSHLPTSTSP